MRENPIFNIVEVDTMSATCRLTLYLMLAVSQTKLHARYWLTVIQLPYRLPIHLPCFKADETIKKIYKIAKCNASEQ